MKNINSVGKTAQEWIKLLENMTYRRELQYLTFLPLSEILTHQNLLKHRQAWCPACYDEMLNAGKVIYQPLIWSVELVKICGHHRVLLVDRCFKCNSQIFFLTPRQKIGYCPRCYVWLGGEASNKVETSLTMSELEWQIFVWNNIEELIVEAPKDPLRCLKIILLNGSK